MGFKYNGVEYTKFKFNGEYYNKVKLDGVYYGEEPQLPNELWGTVNYALTKEATGTNVIFLVSPTSTTPETDVLPYKINTVFGSVILSGNGDFREATFTYYEDILNGTDTYIDLPTLGDEARLRIYLHPLSDGTGTIQFTLYGIENVPVDVELDLGWDVYSLSV